ncbi:hypothetical protein [Arthrobacter sp. LjRoot14]|uniref:hypothetical protein n=1 Tax=Arthrobacter sp. LjRoot14 TaxID=3342265 RepID=UPI003ECFE204
MNTFITICYIANTAVFVYALTRPSALWLSADRNRVFWITVLAIFGVLGAGGLIADAAFLLLVLPRMLRGGNAAVSEDPRVRPNPFVKH